MKARSLLMNAEEGRRASRSSTLVVVVLLPIVLGLATWAFTKSAAGGQDAIDHSLFWPLGSTASFVLGAIAGWKRVSPALGLIPGILVWEVWGFADAATTNDSDVDLVSALIGAVAYLPLMATFGVVSLFGLAVVRATRDYLEKRRAVL